MRRVHVDAADAASGQVMIRGALPSVLINCQPPVNLSFVQYMQPVYLTVHPLAAHS